MNKDDRNTAIIVIGVLVVCTISLVAIFNSLWNIVSPWVTSSLEFVGFNIRINNVTYNFPVPEITNPPAVALEANYNFAIPAGIVQYPLLPSGVDDPIISDARIFGYRSDLDVNQVDFIITIPKITLQMPVISGRDDKPLLEKGMWHLQFSPGHHTLLCAAFANNNSCFFLPLLEEGDEIFMSNGAESRIYKVTDKFEISDEFQRAYAGDISNQPVLRLVTATSAQSRTVIIAAVD